MSSWEGPHSGLSLRLAGFKGLNKGPQGWTLGDLMFALPNAP